jgi:hypothetical protein
MERVEELKREINELWEEVFQIRIATGHCLQRIDCPPKDRVLKSMVELRKMGEKEWVLQKFIEIRERLAEIDDSEGKSDDAALQRQKARYTSQKLNRKVLTV